MVHIVAYADESYLDDGFVFMGGYTAPVDTWIDFAGKWKSVLIEHPEVPYFSNRGFKSQEWQRNHGVVDAHLLPAKTLKLATLVARSGLWFPVVSTIEKSLFEKVIKSRVRATKNPRYELLRDPYYFGLCAGICKVLNWRAVERFRQNEADERRRNRALGSDAPAAPVIPCRRR